jgi:L-cysteine/cystine lyase
MSQLLPEATVEELREQLPAVRRVAYLNAGSLGPLPRVAAAAMDAQDHYDVEIRQTGGHWDRLSSLQTDARGALVSLTGVGPDQVALMHSTHEGINACLWGMDLEAGDNVVTTDEEHPGLLVPLAHARTRTGCEVRVAPWEGDDDAFVDGILALVDKRTRTVMLSHISWQSGRVAPLRALRDALPGRIRIIADGAQSAGIVTVDPSDGWDAFTVSGQKWPCGPNGSGGLALLDPEAWHPTFGAYAQLGSWDEYIPVDVLTDGRRFEMSQEALQPLAGFTASVRWITSEIGISRAQAHAEALNERVRARLEGGGIDPARLLGEQHLLTLDVPDGRGPGISRALLDRGFLIRYLTGERVRLSLGFWNTPEELDECVDALLEELASAPA